MKPNTHYTVMQSSSIGLFIIMLGVMAGFFWTYTFSVNPAMMQVDGEYYATVQSLFNVNVRNGMFFSFFFGSSVTGVLAVLLNVSHRHQLSFWLIVLATLLYTIGIIVYTKEINLPLNFYTESWDPKQLPSDWQAVRDQWNDANGVRVITSLIAFLLAVMSLLIRSISIHRQT